MGAQFGCSSTDVAGLLHGVGAEVAGAAQYVAPDTTPEESLPGEVEWLSADDVASALPHLNHPRKARFAQKIGGEYRPSFIERRHWDRLARSVGLGADEALARIVALAGRLPDALADAARASNLTVDEQRVADNIRDQIIRWAGAQVGKLTS